MCGGRCWVWTNVGLADGFTDPPRRRPDLGKRRFDARIGHVLGMTKHFGAPGGIFVPKPSLCLVTLLRWAPELGATVRLHTPPVALQKNLLRGVGSSIVADAC